MAAPEATAPTAGYTPVVTDLLRIVRALFSPGDVFEEQRDQPTFWMPWLILGLAFAALNLLNAPFQQRAAELMLAARGAAAPTSRGLVGQVIGFVVTPLFVLIMCSLAAATLWVPVMAMGEEAGFKRLLSVVVFAFPVRVLEVAVTSIVLRMRGLDAVRSIADLKVALGLNLLLPADSEVGNFVDGLLGGISPFSIWSLIITAVGLQVLLKLSAGKAWTAAVVSFLIVLLVSAGLAAAFGGMMG